MIYNGKYTIDQLREMVLKAMHSRQEGTNYDFKVKWDGCEDKDYLSMLNVLNDKDCFIVVGVDEVKDNLTRKVLRYEIKNGLTPAEQKDQSFLNNRTKNFHPNPLGNLHLNNIEIDDKTIQVLSIENRLFKPYLKIDNHGKMICPIYIRHNESSEGATPEEVQELYRYRFRLNESYDKKFVRYLDQENINNWIHSGLTPSPPTIHEFYYNESPEYRIVTTQQKLSNSQELIFNISLLFHSTPIQHLGLFHYSENWALPYLFPDRCKSNKIIYNTCLIVSGAVSDLKVMPLEDKKRIFDKKYFV